MSEPTDFHKFVVEVMQIARDIRQKTSGDLQPWATVRRPDGVKKMIQYLPPPGPDGKPDMKPLKNALREAAVNLPLFKAAVTSDVRFRPTQDAPPQDGLLIEAEEFGGDVVAVRSLIR